MVMADSDQIKSDVADHSNTDADTDIDRADDQPKTNYNEESRLLGYACLQAKVKETAIPTEPYEEATLSKFSILKNLIVVSVSFVFLFSAYNSFQNLQSTINADGSLGTVGLFLLYLIFALSSLFIVTYTLSWFSYKRTMQVSMVTFVLYACTGFYSTWATVLVASVLIGLGSAHLWVAKQAYVTALARQYAHITNTEVQYAIDLFFGIFYGMFGTEVFACCLLICQYYWLYLHRQSGILSTTAFTAAMFAFAHIWGNIFSSFVLRPETAIETESLELCGVNFCPMKINQTQLHPPPVDQLFMYTGLCVGLGCLAIATTSIFLSNFTVLAEPRASMFTMLKSVCCHIANSRAQKILIIPSLYRGINEGFIVGDFTVAFVSCPFGVHNVGFVMIAFGTSLSVFSLTFGKLAKYTDHLLLFSIGFVAQFSVGMTLLLWQADPNKPVTVFVFAALWACGDAVYATILTALYSIHFKENSNAAFSAYRFLAALGWAISFGLSSFVCMIPKIITLLVILSLSFAMLVALRLHRKNSSTAPEL